MVIPCDSAAAFNFFIQDPVYGKGKLGEIQGLVLGMLDTFNYEQVSCMHCCSVRCCMQGLLLAVYPTTLSHLPFLSAGKVNGHVSDLYFCDWGKGNEFVLLTNRLQVEGLTGTW